MEALGPYLIDWLHLAARWTHIAAAIAWVGTSFYFIALDYSLRAPERDDAAREGVGGESWEIHGGGFYRIEKFRTAPARLPEVLHWFKWEAYATWLTGFALLVLLYYLDPIAYLIDPSVADLAPWQAVLASLAILGGGWLAYDMLARRVRDPRWLAVAVTVLAVAVVWVSFKLFAARGAYIEVGATLGTWMAANVFFVIIPGQRELVAATRAGREPGPDDAIRGKQRSVHNNYLTLPVLLAMISQHFPFIYAREQAWLVLLALMAVGVAIRHFFNLRHQGRTLWSIPLVTFFGLVALAAAVYPSWAGSSGGAPSEGSFAAVQGVIGHRCLACHSVQPIYPGITVPPKGLAFDSPEAIRTQARRIYEQVVVTRTMPLGNVTGITEEERTVIARWFRGGAR